MRLAETSAPPKPLSRGSAGAQGARPRRHAARHETLRHGDMGRWFTSFRLYEVWVKSARAFSFAHSLASTWALLES